jgi:broad specificity phosphatase PhoE
MLYDMQKRKLRRALLNMMTNDPPLTEAGKQRAEDLKKTLKGKKIGYIFSTNTIRTRSTAEPLSVYLNLVIETYQPVPTRHLFPTYYHLRKTYYLLAIVTR